MVCRIEDFREQMSGLTSKSRLLPRVGQNLPLLDKLTKAPVKQQQQLFALKVYPLSNAYYHVVLGIVTTSSINEIDKTERGIVRQWLALLNDTPTTFFIAALMAEGELGISSLR